MSPNDPEKNQSKDAPPETDDELESLSADEKAAFEKIMAEINAANGADTVSHAEPSTAPPAAAPEPKPTAGGNNLAEDGTQPAVAGGAPSENSEDDALSEEQQAGIDQIMAQIESKRNGDSLTIADEDQGGESNEMSDDQQAALDKIMAEIESKRGGDRESDLQADEPEPELEPEMSDDQQAALDKIMAEIESKRGGDRESDREADSQEPESEMSDDQQAALDKIMAEIESKKSREDIPFSDEAETEVADVDEGIESQSDLEASVAEIKKSARQNRNPDAEQQADTTGNLTMEEFDDELSQLLSTAQADSLEKASDKAKAGGKKEGAPLAVNKRLGQKITEMQSAIKSDIASDDLSKDPLASGKRVPAPNIDAYAILQEVPFSEDMAASRTPKTGQGPGRQAESFWSKKSWIGFAVALNIVLLAGAGYWAYHYGSDAPHRIDSQQVDAAALTPMAAPTQPLSSPPTWAEPAAVSGSSEAQSGSTTGAAAQSTGTPAEWAGAGSVQTAGSSFAGLQVELAAARNDIQIKISDIQQLKSYYSRGVAEEIEKIENVLINGKIPSFEQAMADTRIELGMRAIQRRGTYITKLDTPLAQLTAKSEELLFLERRARTFEILNRGIHGLPLANFSREANAAIASFLEFNTQLSIDRVEVAATPMAEVWRMVSKHLSEKANLLAQRTPLNRAISAEICKGNYSRNYMLTALSPETATCLIKWSGKDLYLNELTELTPEVAQILAQWPGEWLSLNGLWELSGAAARQLAQWPGKRLSLNGLVALSPEATAQLSQWQGAQLEMVGLMSIGRWENYGTRLYLSEKLKNQLEAQ
jgi:hypothetical protein